MEEIKYKEKMLHCSTPCPHGMKATERYTKSRLSCMSDALSKNSVRSSLKENESKGRLSVTLFQTHLIFITTMMATISLAKKLMDKAA